MDDKSDKADNSHVRKTLSFTHRQVGAGGAIIAALISIQPLKELIRDESKTTVKRLENVEITQIEIKKLITENDKEAVRRQERSNDKIIDRIKEAEARTVSSQERIERRVDTLEASIMTEPKKHRN